jgi:hypothetical protein
MMKRIFPDDFAQNSDYIDELDTPQRNLVTQHDSHKCGPDLEQLHPRHR